jgi:hypothetical protein
MKSRTAFSPEYALRWRPRSCPCFRIAQTTHIAYDNPIGFPANQTFAGNVGMDFNIGVNSIKVLELGVFDSGQDGFLSPRTVSIWDRDSARW